MIGAEYITHSGDDLLVVNAARVSFAKHSHELNDRDRGLINYLARHGHWTPFAHPQITLHITAPIFVRTQCFKHKVGFVENEVSRRYVDDEPSFYLPGETGWRERSETAKQGSGDALRPLYGYDANGAAEFAYDQALGTYNYLLSMGVAPEQARMVLPQGTMTEWFWTGSLAAWARFVRQRTDPHAQAETAFLARCCAQLIEPLFPVSWAALVTEVAA